MKTLIRNRQRLKERWGSLRITSKFGLAFGLLLLILLMQTGIAFVALTITWNSNNTILDSSQIQRLVMVMSRNWETVRRLEQSFFIQSPLVGADRAYPLYALPASGRIAEVVRDGAALKRLSSAVGSDDVMRELAPGIVLVLSDVSQYATGFENATQLELQLSYPETGLYAQLQEKAALLSASLQAVDQSAGMIDAYAQLRLIEEEVLRTQENASVMALLGAAPALRQIIQEDLRGPAVATVLRALDDYVHRADEIQRAEAHVQSELDGLDTLGQAIELGLVDLIIASDARAAHARLEIERTRQTARIVLIVAMTIGVLVAGLVALLFHHTVTRTIVRLTQVASQLRQGDLEVRSPVTGSDELGQLASAFNEMTDALGRRMTEVERLHRASREQAIRDTLTGLYNRRFLDETLPRALQDAGSAGLPITLVMLDIDFFKVINDRFGHAIGDRALIDLAAILVSYSRAIDVCCRYGGEEFMVLMSGVNLAVGVRRANEWRHRFHLVAVQGQDGVIYPTLSAGVVEWRPGESSDELLERVDTALYVAKNSGRDRVATEASLHPQR